MSKCVICGNDSGKGKTCGSTCRSKLARRVALVKGVTGFNEEIRGLSVANATVEKCCKASVATPAIPNYGLDAKYDSRRMPQAVQEPTGGHK